MHSKKIIFLITEDWVFCTHRLPLAIAAQKAGFEVLLITNVTSQATRITDAGIGLIPLNLDRRSLNPFKAFLYIFKLFSIYRHERPDIVHHVALKPILLGSIAAKFAGVPCVVNAITGMGYLSTAGTFRMRIVRGFVDCLLRILLKQKNSRLIMQNKDDIESLIADRIIDPSNTRLIRGAGVDTTEYRYVPEPASDPVTIVFPARMLRDKGVVEFVNAATILKNQSVHARFLLVGDTDPHNRASLPEAQLKEWVDEGVVEWLGRRDDMPAIYRDSHIVCLPSYREGVPKALLEAASSGRPIVTTDTVGCREVVQHAVNGYLVPLQDADALARSLRLLIEDPDLRQEMGGRGREIVLEEFAIEKVTANTLAVYDELLDMQSSHQGIA